VRVNLATLADLRSEMSVFLADDPPRDEDAGRVLAEPGARELCAALAEALGQLETLDAERFKSTVQSVGASLGRRGRALFQPVRAALTGRTHGPELPLVAELLGANTCVGRLATAARGGGAREWRA
jgi:nondiscriminating glutamyl-tRNA synthetase